jgi:sarcosine oxidase gamma subunit
VTSISLGRGPVRRATNARATRDTGLWANAAKARKESAIRELRLARAVHRFKSPVSKQLENFLRTQAAADHKTAVAYRAYSASSAKDHVRLLDCSSFPPPSH